ncbi:hypothetical protein OV208_37395 [Corallococcus sp. bb12-1]|uniref:hypothetical protein n=1 Tax=Corallococcus sp. bb12-1 TaxID=2996784 RepID=UPI0022709CFB|nr:hypothetical protein [Corallococcus sp. bb12-1]MCY1047037.1 hypothetical protein [Corallococcus sp. bb12-1]
MEPQDWLQKAFDELVELASLAEIDLDDAWRGMVLISRLLGSPSGPTPPAEVLRRLPALREQAGRPDPESLVARLSEELAADDDAEGALLDSLLDVDDALGVLSLNGDTDAAQALSRSASELLVRFPSRVRPLEDFATLRGATVRPDSEVATLWKEVAHVPATPATRAPASEGPRQDRLSPARHRSTVVMRLPSEALRAQAWTVSSTVPFLSQDGATQAWLYEESGQLWLELRGAAAPPTSARFVVSRRGDAIERASFEVSLETSGNTAYADLGPIVGQGNRLHALLAQAGLAREEADLRLVVMNDP